MGGEMNVINIYKFQSAFKTYLGSKHAIATSSCTGALHIALKTLGIKPGDEDFYLMQLG